ncbi:MAG: glycosyltransferase family 1 protein [candidate division WOR-3 bacterium]
MKIAINILAAKSQYHGIGVYASNILPHVFSKMANAEIYLLKRKGSFLMFNTNFEKQITVKDIELTGPRRIIWEWFSLPHFIKSQKLDILWGVCNFLPPVKSCKYIVTIHDLAPFVLPRSLPLVRRTYYRNCFTNSIRLADKIIVVSKSLKNDLIKYFPESAKKIIVIHCGLAEKFHPVVSKEQINKVRGKYRLPANFIFTLGVLEPKKNIERLILAYIELKKSHSNLPKLVIGGPRSYGWNNSKIFNLVTKYKLSDEIIFTDFIDHTDLPEIYSISTIFVLPSLYEGFGLPVIEAMACGTPVITSNISSLPEVAGDAAVLVNPYSVSEIANAIKEVLSNEKERQLMVERGLENVKRFNWEKAAQKVIEVFEEVYNS